jgi:transglutaminase-like putative cysteine protease
MRPSSRLTVAAGVAAGLGTVPVGALFDSASWIFPAAAAIAVVTSFHVLARVLRLPPALVPAAGLLGLLLFMCFAYAQGGNLAGLVPTGHSLALLREGLRGGFEDIRIYASPAPTTQGLMLIVTLVAGLMTVVVDTLAVTARRPAVAGLVMLALYAVPTAISTDAVPWLFFVAGAGGYLVLLLAEERERLLRWGRPVSPTDPSWQGDPAPVRFTGRTAGVSALVLAVLVPLFVPGISANGLAGIGATGGNGPGGGTRIDPLAALQGQLNRGGEPIEMLQLSTDNTDLHYLRTQVLDRYTDHGWSESTPVGTGQADGELTRQAFGDSRNYTADIHVTQYSDRYLPIPEGTYHISGLPQGENWQYDEDRAMIFGTVAQSTNRTYRIDAADPRPTVETLRLSGPADEQTMAKWGQVPRNFSGKVAEKVRELTAGKPTPYDKAKAIRDYFSPDNGFTYSTSTLVGNSGSELADFVLEKKQGYCQQYAAAMAIMLRQAGVPARVVIGFTRHTAAKNGVWSILNTDAHAWVEAYFTGLGWIPFDPTPPDPTTPGRMAGFGDWDPPFVAAPLPTESSTPDISDVPGSSAGAGKPIDNTQDPTALADQGSTFSPVTVLVGIGVLLVLVLLATPALARVTQRRRRLATAGRDDPGAAARAAWDELLATASDLDVPLRTDETPRTVARRVTAELTLTGPPAAGLRLIALAEERARYARVAHVDGDLPTAVRAVRAGLLATRRRRRRLLAALMPPSVLRTARTSMRRRNDQVSGQLERMGADLRRTLRFRRRSRA